MKLFFFLKGRQQKRICTYITYPFPHAGWDENQMFIKGVQANKGPGCDDVSNMYNGCHTDDYIQDRPEYT